ncbi:hypothetical protein Tco_0894811 [Tanacetum coccineum]|uniref:Retrotransposon gag domain-containing protein n=1 Tax=Tanacetum coccineum TaxID=301880 RepID=A0ABQ5CE22_9ASTR
MTPTIRNVASTSDEVVTRHYVDSTMAETRELITGLGMQNNQMARRQANQFGRLAKVEFPKFQGDDVMGWVFKCEQFFINTTPEVEKEKITCVHLFDKALLWHRQFLKTNRENMDWDVYKGAIIKIFGYVFDDPISALNNAKYEKNAREYQDVTIIYFEVSN